MANPIVASVPRTGNAYIDGLLYDTKWGELSLTYSFPGLQSSYTGGASYGAGELSGFITLPIEFRQAHRFILEGASASAGGPRFLYGSFEDVTNLAFTEIIGGGATIRSALTTTLSTDPTDAKAPAHAYDPRFAKPDLAAAAADDEAGDVWFNANFFTGANAPAPGNFAWYTIIHELGHSVGLKHPHETGSPAGSPPVYTTLPLDRDSVEFTVMSYRSYINGPITSLTNEAFGFPQTLMMYDIRALQEIYGVNTTTNAGNTSYRWDPLTGEMFLDGVGQGAPGANRVFLTIWDSGGVDTYDMSNYSNAVSIDLTPGRWSITAEDQRAILDRANPTRLALGNVYNALQYKDDARSLIENAIGGSGNDTIVGNFGANRLEGGAGADLLFGGRGADTLLGGIGDDSLYGGADTDTLDGGSGFDTASYTDVLAPVTITYDGRLAAPELTVSGTESGFDTLVNIERVIGTGGADRVRILGQVRSGSLTIDAGAGRESRASIDGSGAANGLNIRINPTTGEGYIRNKGQVSGGIQLRGFNTDIVGSAFDDDIFDSSTASKHLDGGDGNDWIEVTQGDSVLIGGAGNDILWGGSGSDRLHGGVGDDEIDGGLGFDWADYSSSAAGVFVDLAIIGRQNTGQGFDVIIGIEGVVGSAFADTILGTASSEIFEGGAGADRLEGFGGDDTLNGGAGVDTLIGGAGNDAYHLDDALDVVRELAFEGFDGVYFGGIGTYTLTQYVEDLILVGPATGGIGNEGGNGMFGNAAANRLEGMLGDDRLFGAAGDDQLFGQGGNDDLRGELGNDGLFGGQGDDFLDGGDGDDSITGGLHQDILVGGAGADFMQGNDGNDVLNGGGGADQMYGGFGADRFDFFTLADSVVGASDRIHDFNVAEGDLIDLSRIDADQAALGDQAFIFVAGFSGRAGEAVLTFDGATNTSVLNLDVNGDGLSDFRLEMTGSVGTSQGWVL